MKSCLQERGMGVWGGDSTEQGKEGVTRGVVVFSQGEDRIIDAQLWIKLKLPARKQGHR